MLLKDFCSKKMTKNIFLVCHVKMALLKISDLLAYKENRIILFHAIPVNG